MHFYGANQKPEEPKNNTNIDVLVFGVGIIVLAILLALIGILLRTVILTLLWDWYIVYHFGMKPLTLPVAFGISLLFAFLKDDAWNRSSVDKTIFFKAFAFNITCLIFGYLGTFFL